MSVFKLSETYRPFTYPWAVEEARKHAIDDYWDVHEVDLLDDTRQYKSQGGLATKDVTHQEHKDLVDSLVCLFTELDKSVGEGYTKLLPHIQNNEIRNLILTFAAREVVHQRAYALAAETFGFPDSAWVAFKDYVEMQDKLDLISREVPNLHKPLQAAKHLSKILLGEGIGLFAAFASFLNLKTKGLLIGFNDVNQWSLSDELSHVENNVRIVKAMSEDLSPAEVRELTEYIINISQEYVDCELVLIDLIFSICPQQDITKEGMKQYMRHLRGVRLDQLSISMGDIPDMPEEFEFMDWLTQGANHDNFFEKKVTDYSHDPLKGDVDYSKYVTILENRVYG
jgi:ribonucleotide reductase beta subunit family protein with ferritin-like domain